jgi:mono/diheme cytochrome c family protein
MNKWTLAIALSALASAAYGNNLCSLDAFSKAEAEQGKVAFDSHCALCHQYNMTGREPGNYQNESPDINLLSAADLKFLDGAGGNVPPLIGAKFFRKQDGKTLTEFTTSVAGAANTFPPKDFQSPKSYFLIAAYVIYRNCGKM